MEKGEMLANALSENMAPCQYCGYNGEGYYQAKTHEPYCRWYTVGGQLERAKILMKSEEWAALKIEICGEDALNGGSVKLEPTDIAISITSPNWLHPNVLKTLPSSRVLFLTFYDINPYNVDPQHLVPYQEGLMTDAHAAEILTFMDKSAQLSDVTRCIVQCEAGISRSPAVALALSIIFGCEPSPHRIHRDHMAYNEYVLMKILNVWRLQYSSRILKNSRRK